MQAVNIPCTQEQTFTFQSGSIQIMMFLNNEENKVSLHSNLVLFKCTT